LGYHRDHADREFDFADLVLSAFADCMKSNVARRYKANNLLRIAARQLSLWSCLV
jgi:hypothetical protein